MPSAVENISDQIAGSLVLQALAKVKGFSATNKKFLSGKKPAYDIIVEHVRYGDDQYSCFTFYAVKTGKSKSAFKALGELVLKDAVSKIFDFAAGEASSVYSTAGDISGGIGAGGIDTAEIYATASKIGGQMQLHAAKKMGRRVYDQARIFGLGANINCGGAVRFEEVKYQSCSGLNIVLSAWSSPHSWIDRFSGPKKDSFGNLQNWRGDWHCDYIYNPATGDLWE